jgi:hypothetical protein
MARLGFSQGQAECPDEFVLVIACCRAQQELKKGWNFIVATLFD